LLQYHFKKIFATKQAFGGIAAAVKSTSTMQLDVGDIL
jgi:hypothetical protein